MRKNPHITGEALYAGARALRDVAKKHFQSWRSTIPEHKEYWGGKVRGAIRSHRQLYLAAVGIRGNRVFATWADYRNDIIRRRKTQENGELQKTA